MMGDLKDCQKPEVSYGFGIIKKYLPNLDLRSVWMKRTRENGSLTDSKETYESVPLFYQ